MVPAKVCGDGALSVAAEPGIALTETGVGDSVSPYSRFRPGGFVWNVRLTVRGFRRRLVVAALPSLSVAVS